MIIHGRGVLWDPERHKPAARFVGGRLETDDPRIIELAEMAGFVFYEGEPVAEQAPERDLTREDLIEIAEENGIEIDKRWGFNRLKSAVLDG